MNIYGLAGRFRQAQLRAERQAASEMVRVYGGIWQEIQRQITDLTQRYYQAPEPRQSWLYELKRLQVLRSQVEAQLLQFAQYANTAIQAQQWLALQAGREHARQLLEVASNGSLTHFNILPADALTFMLGFQQDGSPLLEVLNRYGQEAAQAMADRLVQGLALGEAPGTIARLLRKDVGMALWEALRLARTETLRAYRTASHATYQANSDIVEGWYWLSARNTRTCAMCWAMDGTFHKLEETLDDHPNGRCTQVPKIKGIELPARLTGVEAFEQLNDVDQLRVLGPSKYAAYQQGALKLADLIGVKHSQEWGRMFYERSLKGALGAKALFYTSAKAIKAITAQTVQPTFAEMLSRLESNRVLRIGNLNKAILQKAGFDVENTEVIITGERRHHYLDRHPEMAAVEWRLDQVVINPSFVSPNKTNPDILLFYLKGDDRYLRATVRMQRESGEYKHSVISLRFARSKEVKRDEKRALYKK